MANQIVVSAGAKVRNLQDVIIGTSGVLTSLGFDVANGVPRLDVNGKILVSQLPNSVMEYKGTWNVSTNTPTLVNGTGNQGDVYLVEGAAVGGTAFNFGAGPITFFNGDQAIYSGSIWQRASGATGTVTSVAVTESGDSLNITGSPITTSGTINIGFNGTNLQYVNGAGNLTTFPTLITSIGLSMPSAFSVANSPLTANGTIAVTGAGTTAQYIRGDGSLATFPTIATEAQRLITEVYNETGATLTKGTVIYINGGHGNLPTITKAIATGDATSAQTYGVVQNDISDNNNGFVVVIGSLGDLDTQSYPNGTQLYLSPTTAGAWTSVKQYAPAHLVYVAIVTRSHPTQGVVEVRIQNGFELDELHNVSAQTPSNNQGLFYNTSTSLWENKSIATALGYTPANDALVVHLAGNETIGGTKTFSDATKNNGGIFLQNSSSSSLAGYMNLGGLTNGVRFTSGGGITNTFTLPSATGYTYTFPNATGTIALTSDISYPVTSVFGRTGAVVATEGDYSLTQLSDVTITTPSSGQVLRYSGTAWVNSTETYVGTVTSVAALTIGTSGTDLSSSVANSTTTPVITLNVPTASASNRGALSSADWTTFNNKQNALTNPVTGTGTTNYLPKFTGTSTIGNSLLYQNDIRSVSINVTTGTNDDGNLVVAGSDGTGQGAANTVAQINIWETTSGSKSGLWFGAMTNEATGVIGSRRANGNIAFQTYNGSWSEKMRLTSSGNLGLGVTPSYKLQVYNSSNGTTAAFGGTIYGIRIDNGGTYSSGRSTIFGVDNSFYGSYQPLSIEASSLTLQGISGGNVLINTTTDSGYKLDVNGTGRFSGANLTIGSAVAATNVKLFLNGVASKAAGIEFQQSGTTQWHIGNGIASEDNNFELYNSNGTMAMKIIKSTNAINFQGAATFSSSVTATSFFESSDSRLKTLIQDNYQTKGIASITPKLYTKNGKVELGYYAQDFVGVLDNAISKGSDDMLSLSYREVLVAKVYALEQEIKELKAKMN